MGTEITQGDALGSVITPEMARSAAVTVADHLGPDCRDILDALGPEGFLINISRGTVVDEAALVDALQHQRIAGAGLDVFEDEPRVPEALLALDNVVLLPHLASNTHETRAAMAQRVQENLAVFLAGKPMVSAAA